MRIGLQIALAALLLFSAIRLLSSRRRQNCKNWGDVLANLTLLGLHSRLSRGSIFSEGLDCPIAEIWIQMGGPRGWWAVFCNTGVFLELVDYVEGACETCASPEQDIERLRASGKHLRIAILLALPDHLLAALLGHPSSGLAFAVRSYFAFVAHVSLAVNDYCPSLLNEYRYYVLET